jgi:anthranilate synthase/aminodeoxychorismate synthase-like glutamine amidotransferase
VDINDITLLNPEAIILSPGPGHPKDAGICVELIQHFSGKIPILGVCLGHQAIVHALGGDIISTGKLVHGKASLVYHDQQGIFANMSMPFQAGRYHSLMADPDTLPDVLRITAYSEPNTIMAVQHLEHPTFGVQFHPESILTQGGGILIATWIKMLSQF